MNWEQYRSVMERYAIKTDDKALEDAYFMATHMPFSNLDIYEDGRISSKPTSMNEDEVFEKYVCNPELMHQMIIVRGDNGTGKSHLIRYLKAKFEKSSAYNPEKHQLVFLRRLNNSIRGAFAQLLEENVIQDVSVRDKMKKFIESTDAKDEETFKIDILYSYIAAVSSDMSDKLYKKVICRDIASYLSDSRVKDHLLREGGAISRCYNAITAPSNQVLQDTTIFTEEDFDTPKIIRAVIRQGDPQASDFASTLKGDGDEQRKLITYLNKFTRKVIQHCADISSESAKSVFVQLRKDLKKQGKDLTLFIEDFTGFTGVDSELITALTEEDGGINSDLCRVTAIIGITNDYYDQFRDNFTDRVTAQISVTDRAFGTNDFLVNMTARYLNAIYCDPKELNTWNEDGAMIEDLPISDFAPPCKWEHGEIGGKSATLYPFNRNAIMSLYENLVIKSPRMFLKNCIRAQLKEYFDGKLYGDSWYFPVNPGNVSMSQDQHSSSIDRLEGLTSEDKGRLKTIFAIWGDGSATAIKELDGSIQYGGVSDAFLSDIGLSAFTGIGQVIDRSKQKGQVATEETVNHEEETKGKSVKASKGPIIEKKEKIDPRKKQYLLRAEDINSWFSSNVELKFDYDYRTMLRYFICGDHIQCGAINWQDCGIPAYVANERLSDLGYYYIEGQDTAGNCDKAIVFMSRSVESRDALRALVEYEYHNKSWDFEGNVYYQQRLITWLERNRFNIIRNVVSTDNINKQLPIYEWCLALQYLQANIYGYTIDHTSPLNTVESLFRIFKKKEDVKRETKEWEDLIQFVLRRSNEFEGAYMLLQRASATVMGTVQKSKSNSEKEIYRANELIDAAEKLLARDWNIEEKLPKSIPTGNLLYNPASLLKQLYPKIREVMDAEKKQIDLVLSKLTEYVGEINMDNLIATINSIHTLFSTFSTNGIWGANDLRTKYDHPPKDIAQQVYDAYKRLKSVENKNTIVKLEAYSKNDLHFLNDFLRDIQKIALKADEEERKARTSIQKTTGIVNIDEISEVALQRVQVLFDKMKEMEGYYAAD